jgi:cytidylate kinase
MTSPIIIAIDGPSASGKSSVSKLVAEALSYFHVDTGSMYRAFTWKVLEEKIDLKNSEAITDLIKKVRFNCEFVQDDKGLYRLRNVLDGKDPGNAIRMPVIDQHVSTVSAVPKVREWLVQKQRDLALKGDLVVEGRDIGTVVFPESPFKFYLDASPEVRARRRAKDQKALGAEAKVEHVEKAMSERDQKDSTRTVAPLKIAADAVQIDTSDHTPQDTADVILKHIRSKHIAMNG